MSEIVSTPELEIPTDRNTVSLRDRYGKPKATPDAAPAVAAPMQGTPS